MTNRCKIKNEMKQHIESLTHEELAECMTDSIMRLPPDSQHKWRQRMIIEIEEAVDARLNDIVPNDATPQELKEIFNDTRLTLNTKHGVARVYSENTETSEYIKSVLKEGSTVLTNASQYE